ncbi:MAG: cell division protein FtsZ [Aquabacterium sp.]
MTLTVALIIAAALVLAAVVAHGAWTARRAQPRKAAEEPPRIEPTLPGMANQGGAAADDVDTDLALRAPLVRRMARIDALIDAIVPLALDEPVAAELVLAHLPALRRVGSKVVIFEGLDAETGDWCAVQSGQRYSELQAAAQLANRGGPLSPIEYSEFVQTVQVLADALGAVAVPPDMPDAVARGRELDAFASGHDGQLALKLRARGPAWTVGYIQHTALRHGFVAGALPGRLVQPAAEAGAPPVLVLNFDAQAALAEDPQASAVHELTLVLDLPQTPEAAEPFPAWHRAAHGLAADMSADILDEDGRPIPLQGFAVIGQEVAGLYRALEARDLAAGSPTARRLFSG